MKKIFLKFHLWLAVPFGIIVTIICFTGAMLVLEPDIVKIINRDMIYTESPRHTVLSVKDIVARVKPTLAPDVEITGVTMYSDPELACKVNLSKPRRAAVYVDQYTGGIKGKYERPAFLTPCRGSTAGCSTVLQITAECSGDVLSWALP